jgi:hypothetical protein
VQIQLVSIDTPSSMIELLPTAQKTLTQAKPGTLMSYLELPNNLKNAPLSILSTSDVQLHSLSGASSCFVTRKDFTVQNV